MEYSRVLIFGGNGFVGVRLAKQFVEQGLTPVCVSRTGSMPVHLETNLRDSASKNPWANNSWVSKVEWVQGDANQPDPALFDNVDAVVTLIGSAPIPTFSKATYQTELSKNSEPNLAVIEAAKQSSVRRLVIMGAHLPSLINTDKFAYAKGKRLCLEAAQAFAKISGQHTAVVLQPSAIYGVRHTKAGKSINIGLLMRPIASIQKWLSKCMPKPFNNLMPEQLVSVDAVAKATVNACLDEELEGEFSVLSNQHIINSVE